MEQLLLTFRNKFVEYNAFVEQIKEEERNV